MDDRLWLTNWNKLYVRNEIHLKKAITLLYVGFKITENCNQGVGTVGQVKMLLHIIP